MEEFLLINRSREKTKFYMEEFPLIIPNRGGKLNFGSANSPRPGNFQRNLTYIYVFPPITAAIVCDTAAIQA